MSSSKLAIHVNATVATTIASDIITVEISTTTTTTTTTTTASRSSHVIMLVRTHAS
jgi:hypothetical protein